MIDLGSVIGFDWDEGNRDKNWINHQVSNSEWEEVFLRNDKIRVISARDMSKKERAAYGETNP